MREKRIKDLMLNIERFQRISPQIKVAEAVRALAEKRSGTGPPLLLIVEESGNKEEIVGILSIDNILSCIKPPPNPMEDIPIFWQGQFRAECEAILERLVSEIMSPVICVTHESGTLMEALHLMNSKKADSLAVVQGEDVVGVLSKEDLFEEVLQVATPPCLHSWMDGIMHPQQAT
jgi:CBS domain-containing protein